MSNSSNLPDKLPFRRRRSFLKRLWQAGAALILTGCLPTRAAQPETTTPAAATQPDSTSTPTGAPGTTPEPTQTLSPSATPSPSPTISPSPTPSATPDTRTPVSTGRAESYTAALLRSELERMLDDLGGIQDIVPPGARVGIKVNLTGGTWWDTPDKPPATEYFVVHPALVAALCEILRDAGAAELLVMDGLGDETAYQAWCYRDLLDPLGVQLVDLCKPDPYTGYYRLPTGSGARVYETFFVNGALNELDTFISVGKLKCHTTTGVTLSMKNLFGLVPISEYRRDPAHTNRSAFHGSTEFDTRVPQVILDLNQARPIQLALIDGIMTAEAGAGPWDKNMAQVKPGLLVAGKNPVATDTVATALMGFDPEAAAPASPFVGGDNHLALAREAGMGTNRLSEIAVHGPSIEEARFPFKPAR